MDFRKYISNSQLAMVEQLLEDSGGNDPKRDAHLEGLINKPSPTAWAKNRFNLDVHEYKTAIAFGALRQYSRRTEFETMSADHIMASINLTYHLLNALSFSEYSFPGDKIGAEVAEMLSEDAPEYGKWLIAASQAWLEKFEEQSHNREMYSEIMKNQRDLD